MDDGEVSHNLGSPEPFSVPELDYDVPVDEITNMPPSGVMGLEENIRLAEEARARAAAEAAGPSTMGKTAHDDVIALEDVTSGRYQHFQEDEEDEGSDLDDDEDDGNGDDEHPSEDLLIEIK